MREREGTGMTPTKDFGLKAKRIALPSNRTGKAIGEQVFWEVIKSSILDILS